MKDIDQYPCHVNMNSNCCGIFNKKDEEENLICNECGETMIHEIIVKDPIIYDSTVWEDIPDQDKVKNSVIVLPYKDRSHAADPEWEVIFWDGIEAKCKGMFWGRCLAVSFASMMINRIKIGRPI